MALIWAVEIREIANEQKHLDAIIRDTWALRAIMTLKETIVEIFDMGLKMWPIESIAQRKALMEKGFEELKTEFHHYN